MKTFRLCRRAVIDLSRPMFNKNDIRTPGVAQNCRLVFLFTIASKPFYRLIKKETTNACFRVFDCILLLFSS